MKMSDLQTKEIIDIRDGKRVGVIIDISINNVNGNIDEFILEERQSKGFFNTRGSEEKIIKWHQIVKIGEDIILVDTKK